MHNQGKEKVTLPERLRHCPECKEKNIFSSVERLQYEEDRYWVFCAGKDGCSFLEEFRGKAVVTEDDLIMHGLPGQLIQHMDIFHEDINKIVRFCMSEYIKVMYLVNSTNYDLEAIKDSVRILAESHGLDGFDPPSEVAGTTKCQITAKEDVVNSIQPGRFDVRPGGDFVADACSLELLSQPSQSAKPTEHAEEETLLALADFSDLDLALSQTPQKNQSDEDLIKLFQSFCSEPLQPSEPVQPAEIKDESTLLEERENKVLCRSKKTKNCLLSPKLYNPFDSMKKIADYLVADLPDLYQEEIKEAFSKIEGYNFPQDFANDTTPDKLPLFRILEERERQERIKVEVDEQLKDFKAEMDGFNLLFS